LGNLQERGNLRNPVVGGKVILKRILNSVSLGGRDSCVPKLGNLWALVRAVISIWVTYKMFRISGLAVEILAS
jgi:hypothetical protein